MNRVTAIIVNYNAGDWLIKCVDSLAKSDYPVEIYIVDNASSDNSVQQIKDSAIDQSKINFIENSDNRGFAKANNQILNSVESEYYALVNPDCLLAKQTIGSLVTLLEQDQKVAMASVKILNADGSIQQTSKRKFPTIKNSLAKFSGLAKLLNKKASHDGINYAAMDDHKAQYVEAISGAFMMVRRSAINKIGLLDEGYFMHCEDLDWCKRAHLAGYKVAYYPQLSIVHAKGYSSQSRQYHVNQYLHQGMKRFYKKFYADQNNHFLNTLVYVGIFLRCQIKAMLIIGKRLAGRG